MEQQQPKQEQPIGFALWPPPISIYDDTRPPSKTKICFRFVNTYSVLVVLCLLLSAWYIGFDLYLAIAGIMHFTHYTYSALLMFSVYVWSFTLSLLIKRSTLTLVVMLGFPLINGTTFFVTIAIVIIIAMNADVLNDGSHTDEEVHTADFLLHPLQTLNWVVLLACGMLNEVRCIVRGRWLEWGWAKRGLYTIYFFLIPLLPLLIYGAIEDPKERYSISLPLWLIWLLSIVLMEIIQLVGFLAVLIDDRERLSSDKFSLPQHKTEGTPSILVHRQRPRASAEPPSALGKLSVAETGPDTQPLLVNLLPSTANPQQTIASVDSQLSSGTHRLWTREDVHLL